MEPAVKRVAVFGATGSIGSSTLDVIARHPDRFRAEVLSANAQVDSLLRLCAQFRPSLAIINDAQHLRTLQDGLRDLGLNTRAEAGPDALVKAAQQSDIDIVVAAIVGAAGLPSTLAAARAGKRLLLANKESIVVAGALLMHAVKEGGGELIPIDSEHNALFQCLPAPALGRAASTEIRRLVLTASGGPFRGWRRDRLAAVTPQQACAHPRWQMGQKISVDSATLMNKGLEVIEAHWLFGAAPERIDVVVHPQSIIHSLVDYVDGSMLAQLGAPDMRTALAYGLAWPDRIDAGVAPLDLLQLARLDFEAPDREAFPCLDLAYQALRHGPSATTVLNAANETAVSGFLQGQLRFLAIADHVQHMLEQFSREQASTLEDLLELDRRVRLEPHTHH
jgi:1-deoxy-D-xylulose-5-phosphate reductoisomerase